MGLVPVSGIFATGIGGDAGGLDKRVSSRNADGVGVESPSATSGPPRDME